jgi:hypothetical protein
MQLCDELDFATNVFKDTVQDNVWFLLFMKNYKSGVR